MQVVEGDARMAKYTLIRELRNLSLTMPLKTSEGEWEGEAFRRLEKFEDTVIEIFKAHALVAANHGGKIWTLWNAIVFCATIYTTIGRVSIFV